ncbi:MAG TPA: hypothetical protein VK590_01850 [Saprospiraceae bacterium]|nr:hypothetical protein [Saprospiraceae bacterium]
MGKKLNSFLFNINLKILGLIIFIFFNHIDNYAQNFGWAQKREGAVPGGITTDFLGNIYEIGVFKNSIYLGQNSFSFSSKVDFDPGPDSFTLVSKS